MEGCGNMARQSKDEKIKDLEKRLVETQKLYEQVSKRNQEMIQQAENSFLNSATYNQMKQELERLKSLNKLNDIHLASVKKQSISMDEYTKQIYEDNKRMCENEANTNYWVGITENWHDAKEYEKLRDEIHELKGMLEQKEQAIADRDTEINRLQWIIAKDNDKNQLSISFERIYQLECEIEALKSESAIEQTDNLKEEKNIESEEINKLRKENDELKVRIEEEESKNLDYFQKVRNLEGEISRQKTLRMNVKSDLRQVKRELESERMKKYDQYVPEDAASYQAIKYDLEFYKDMCEQQTDYRKTLEKRIKELEEQVSDLATTTLPTDKAVAIIEQNIEQEKEIKAPKKSGRPPKIDSQKMALVVELKANGHSMRDIAEQLNISVGSVHRYIKMNEKNK